MARRKKNEIAVEVEEAKTSSKEQKEWNILVNKKVIGKVTQKQGESPEAIYRSEHPQKVQTIDEGIREVLSKYNLYDL